MNLNVGGIIGGIAGGGIAAGILFGLFEPDAGRGVAKLVVLGVVLGAVGGNFLWGLVVKKPQ